MPIGALVPDPTFKGKGEAPLMLRSEAMRKLFKAGMSVVDIAAHYGVRYGLAWKTINPPRQPATAKTSTGAKPLTKDRLAGLPKSRLLLIVEGPKKTPEQRARAASAADELDRRYPGWIDTLT